MTIKASGNVGIGVANPSYLLQLSADSAAKPGTNTWTIASDVRVKKDIRPFEDGIDVLKHLNPVWYKYNGKAGFPVNDSKEYIGIVAQDAQAYIPYSINTFKAKLNPEDDEETELLNFNSHAITFILINAVKDLSQQVEICELK